MSKSSPFFPSFLYLTSIFLLLRTNSWICDRKREKREERVRKRKRGGRSVGGERYEHRGRNWKRHIKENQRCCGLWGKWIVFGEGQRLTVVYSWQSQTDENIGWGARELGQKERDTGSQSMATLIICCVLQSRWFQVVTFIVLRNKQAN